MGSELAAFTQIVEDDPGVFGATKQLMRRTGAELPFPASLSKGLCRLLDSERTRLKLSAKEVRATHSWLPSLMEELSD